MELVSIILNAVLGGGFLITLITIRSAKKKANAEAQATEAGAKSTELDNVQDAITIWREMAESLKQELANERLESNKVINEMRTEIESLGRAVKKLNSINNKMVKLLDKITPENLESMVEQIKKIHDEN